MTRSISSTVVPVAYEDALEVLGADPTGILREATDRAARRTGEVVRPLTGELAGLDLARDVVIEIAPMVPGELLRASLPLRWRAARAAGWFPTVTGTLDVAMTRGDPRRTTLTLRLDHRPPLGPVGAVFDRTVARRLAAKVVERFLRELAGRLEELVATSELSSDVVAPPPAG